MHVQEGLDALSEVIYHVETYDVTTIRASTPMFLMTRKIKALGVKMVLSGEGSDEIFGGYLYFHKAPNKEEFHHELVRKIKALHLYDCQRANKSTSAWGLEARVPFLDKEFMEVAMAIDPAEKMIRKDQGRIEKWVMRRAFDDEDNPYLPKVRHPYFLSILSLFLSLIFVTFLRNSSLQEHQMLIQSSCLVALQFDFKGAFDLNRSYY